MSEKGLEPGRRRGAAAMSALEGALAAQVPTRVRARSARRRSRASWDRNGRHLVLVEMVSEPAASPAGVVDPAGDTGRPATGEKDASGSAEGRNGSGRDTEEGDDPQAGVDAAQAGDDAAQAGDDAAQAGDGADEAAVDADARTVGSRFHVGDPAAVALENLAPGAVLAEQLAGVRVGEVSDAVLVEVVAGHDRLASWAAARQAEAIAELHRRRGGGTSALAETADEISARLAITGHAGRLRTAQAVVLTDHPAVADALAAGRIDPRKAHILTHEDAGLPLPEHRALAADLLDDAADLTPPQLQRRLRRAATTADPQAARRRHESAHADRAVTMAPAPDGMAWLTAYIRADHAEAARTFLDSLADSAAAGAGAAETRTRDQLRADAFSDLFRHLLDRGVDLTGQDLPRRHGARPHIQVTVPAGTLLGLGDDPGELAGYGPIPAGLAREIAADGTWRALFTDPGTGDFHHLSARTYRPGADLTRQVIARDVTCTFPGCCQPATRTDLDHIDRYSRSRARRRHPQTIRRNLQALCRRHHNLKTIGRWKAWRDPTTGTITWTAPTGHRYVRRPVRPPGPPPRPPGTITDRTPPY